MQYNVQHLRDLRLMNETKVPIGMNWDSVNPEELLKTLRVFDPSLLLREFSGKVTKGGLQALTLRIFNPETKVLAPEIDVHKKASLGIFVRRRSLVEALLALNSCPGVRVFSKTNLPSARTGDIQGVILIDALDLSIETASLMVCVEACGFLPFVKLHGHYIPYSQLVRTQDAFVYCPRVIRTSSKVDSSLQSYRIHSRAILAVPAAIRNMPGRKFSASHSLETYYEVVI